MIETYVKERNQVDSIGIDANMMYTSLAFYKGELIAQEWFMNYISASLWCLEYSSNKSIIQ